ncbi:MAG: molybdate ABC transporter substrate-binding protein [Beijerinckiaceae bacterium]|nr:molybdate ABC transporter substrate-binding protein [Beijerinckiaceae bacterium]
MKKIIMAAMFVAASGAACADEIKVIVANALKDAYAELAADFEKTTGHKVTTTYSGTVASAKRVASGEAFDIVIIGSDAIDQLIKAGHVAAGSRSDIARSGVGVAVRNGLPKPDVSSADALKATVLNAQSLAFSAGPSGEYVERLLKQLGVFDQIAGKTSRPSSGAEVAGLLIKGEAAFGFGQVSEFLNVAGLTDLGPLPAQLQNYTIYSAGLPTAAATKDAPKAFVTFMKRQEAAPAYNKIGMDPG